MAFLLIEMYIWIWMLCRIDNLIIEPFHVVCFPEANVVYAQLWLVDRHIIFGGKDLVVTVAI